MESLCVCLGVCVCVCVCVCVFDHSGSALSPPGFTDGCQLIEWLLHRLCLSQNPDPSSRCSSRVLPSHTPRICWHDSRMYIQALAQRGTVCCGAADCGVSTGGRKWISPCVIQIQLHICGSNGLQSLSAGPVRGSRCRSVWLQIVFTALRASQLSFLIACCFIEMLFLCQVKVQGGFLFYIYDLIQWKAEM